MSAAALIVLAKAPLPGRSKTRLCPPCSAREAALLAEAALRDTLAAVSDCQAERRVLVLDGEPGDWLPPGFEVLPQVAGDLGQRLGAAFAAVAEPALLVGMDTPQVTPALLADGLEALSEPDRDAVLGPAIDGGYWAIGLRRPNSSAFAGVPMSTRWTAQSQRRRLAQLGLRWRELPPLCDVDRFDDAVEVARVVPRSCFARCMGELESARDSGGEPAAALAPR